MLPLVVLAGGFGTRLGALTENIPKCLIKIRGRAFVDWQIDSFIMNGITNLVFCVSHKSEMIQDHLGDGSKKGIKIQYSIDGIRQLGTGGAIVKALPILGEKFGVIYGDSYLPINYKPVEDAFLNRDFRGLMTVYKNQNELDTSNIEFFDGYIKEYRKNSKNPRMLHIDYGLLYFKSKAFDPYQQGEYLDLANLCNDIVLSKELYGFEVHERFYEVGSLKGIDALSEYLERQRYEF
jgi:NDP-sugar pyrophosphorylase family protein